MNGDLLPERQNVFKNRCLHRQNYLWSFGVVAHNLDRFRYKTLFHQGGNPSGNSPFFSSFKMARTSHDGPASSGRIDLFYDEFIGSGINEFKGIFQLCSLNDFPEVMFLGRKFKGRL